MAYVRNLGKRFLLRCANEHNDFRVSEIVSLATLFKVKLEWVEKSDTNPFLLVDASSEEDIKKIMSRSMLIRSAYELWGRANNYSDLHKQLRAVPKDFLKPYYNPDCSFSIAVETYCKSLTLKEKIAKIEELDYLDFQGPVNLNDPDVCFSLLEFYGTDPNAIPEEPYDIFFGRLICNGQRSKISQLTLKTRKFIGNTSMDPQLSLIMANQALVEPNSIVYDPFVGSGSLLVAAAHFGAYVWGIDINYLMLHGKAKPTRCKQNKREKGENVAANLRQYSLHSQYMDVLVADSSQPMWRDGFKLDAIITDPPYGIRESTEKVGAKRSYQINDRHLETHIPSKVSYSMQDMYVDLLNFAARHLKLGGRLVFWLPVYLEDYSEESIPRHSCLELVSNSEQPLAVHSSRRLITMAKIKEVTEVEIPQVQVSEKTALFSKQYFKAMLNNRAAKKLEDKRIHNK